LDIASSAIASASSLPATNCSRIARPDLPMTLLATLLSLMLAPSNTF
jgi:hypothetical protein